MTDDRKARLARELFQVIAELELVSHVSSPEPRESFSRDASESIGGRRPGLPSFVLAIDDREVDYPQKSAEHFRRRARRAYSEATLGLLLKEASAALVACRRQPPETEPRFGSPQWKRFVAESNLSLGDLARKFGCSRSYIKEVRDKYRVLV